MGSPYLLAHGLGKAVKDAQTEVQFSTLGEYRVFVRTKDWVARWNAEGSPGSFRILVNGVPLDATFGTQGNDWHWQDGGKITIDSKVATVTLQDLDWF